MHDVCASRGVYGFKVLSPFLLELGYRNLPYTYPSSSLTPKHYTHVLPYPYATLLYSTLLYPNPNPSPSHLPLASVYRIV